MKTSLIEQKLSTLIEAEKVAERWGFTPKTWRHWATESVIDHLRLGRRILFPPHQLERFLEQGVVTGNASSS